MDHITKQLESYRPPPVSQDTTVVNAVLSLTAQVGSLVTLLKEGQAPAPSWRPVMLVASATGAAVGCFFALSLLLMGARVEVPVKAVTPAVLVAHE